MPEVKHIIVLANSIKHWPSRCIAGREIVSGKNHYEIGAWVRPISGASREGELYESETRLGQARQPRVFDFVEVPIKSNANDRLQPENWMIDSDRRWRLMNQHYQHPDMSLLVEQPANLWLQRSERPDRVSPAYLRSLTVRSSICLVHVPSLELSFGWSEWQGEWRRRRRARFAYNGVQYDLGLTDPVLMDQYRNGYPSQNEPPRVCQLTNPAGYFLCVSVTPPLGNYHYKVVATVIEAT